MLRSAALCLVVFLGCANIYKPVVIKGPKPYGPDDLQRIADSLNNRPRKTLDWLKPCERLAEVIASTA